MDTDKPIPAPHTSGRGGVATVEKLTDVFYGKVRQDQVLKPVFRYMPAEHSHHVAHIMAEILMGPKQYSAQYGTDALRHMVSKHLTEQQRKQWR